MQYINRVSGRAWHYGNQPKPTERPIYDPGMDFDVDMFRQENNDEDPIEVIKGEHGRIAVKSTMRDYEILVWLPGFS
jgi:hypothetical protein